LNCKISNGVYGETKAKLQGNYVVHILCIYFIYCRQFWDTESWSHWKAM